MDLTKAFDTEELKAVLVTREQEYQAFLARYQSESLVEGDSGGQKVGGGAVSDPVGKESFLLTPVSFPFLQESVPG